MIPGLLLLMFFQPLCFFNPSVLRPPPLYLLRKTQGRSVIHVFLYSSMCFLYNNIKHSHLLPLYCCVTRQRESVRFDFVAADVFSTPSVSLTPPSFGHLPYILLRKTQRRREKHPVMLRGTAEEEGVKTTEKLKKITQTEKTNDSN